jgi:hypothetical protein
MRSLWIAGCLLGVFLVGQAAAKKAAKCPDATYLVDGALLPVVAVGRVDRIVIAGRTVAIGSGCEAQKATFKRSRKGTRVRARWRACGGVERVRVRGLIQKGCTEFVGTLAAKGLDPKTIIGILDPQPPPELAEGLPIVQSKDCATIPLLDAVETLCQLFGVSPCVSQTSTCSVYQRQIYTGAVLDASPIPAEWNGRGGSGELVADALVCSLRALSPAVHGPIVSTPASIDLGALGTLSLSQEIGFTSFDRLRERFEGYRRVTIDMPVVGKAQAVTQRFSVDKTVLGGFPYAAGTYPLDAGYGLTIATEDTTKILSFTPPGFTVTTPLGPVSVNPEFTYGTRAAVVTAPYAGGNLENDPLPLYAGEAWYLRLFDLYGIDPGLVNTATATGPGTYASHRGGWSSQIGLGSRGTVLGQTPWMPPVSGRIVRPDDDLVVPRSTTEASPSAYVSASAKVTWPSDPHDLLPSWVFQIPFLDPPVAQLTVEPRVQAGVGAQLLIGASEATDHEATGEFDFGSRRLSTGFMTAAANAVGLFSVEAGVRLRVRADFPFPIGSKTFVDIDKKFPIPIAGAPSAGAVSTAGGASADFVSPAIPASLSLLQPFKGGILNGAAAADAFIEECYAAQDLAPQPVPSAAPEPGDPTDLLDGAEWPCNICINTVANPQLDLTALKLQYDDLRATTHPEWPPWPSTIPANWVAVLVPAATTPTWKCDTYDNTGCYDVCTWNPETAALTVVREPKQIVPLLPPTPDYDDERFLLNGCDRAPPA